MAPSPKRPQLTCTTRVYQFVWDTSGRGKRATGSVPSVVTTAVEIAPAAMSATTTEPLASADGSGHATSVGISLRRENASVVYGEMSVCV